MANVITSVSNKIVDENGNIYNSIRQLCKELKCSRERVSRCLNRDGYVIIRGVTYALKSVDIIGKVTRDRKEKEPSLFHDEETRENVTIVPRVVEVEKPREDEKEYQEFRKMKEDIKSVNDLPVMDYDFVLKKHKNGTRYAVALFSDVHLEQTIEKESVLGKNEYNLEIAEQRVRKYFTNLVLCLNDDRVENLIFACLGDIINGLIHESYLASNSMMPMDAVIKGQSLIYSGLKFILKNTKIKKLLFIGVIGNHSRTTKKVWSSGAYKMSYEYLMYKNIESFCKAEDLPIEFIIPNSDKAIINLEDGNVFLFEHGDAVRSTGQGVCGIYPALGRYRLKTHENFGQTKLFIGHYHQCCQMKGVVVNGSIVGQDNFALRNGFAYEPPAQMYEVYDSSIGLLNTRQIYCE